MAVVAACHAAGGARADNPTGRSVSRKFRESAPASRIVHRPWKPAAIESGEYPPGLDPPGRGPDQPTIRRARYGTRFSRMMPSLNSAIPP
jgi:hypothetical protein